MSLALALTGCATSVLKSSVEVPGQYAASPAEQVEPEVAWWEKYGDPVLSDLVRRAALENRDVKIAAERVRAARAGETISRSWLLPSIGASAGGAHYDTGYGGAEKQMVPDVKAAGGGLNVSWEADLSGRLRAGASAAEADTKWRLSTTRKAPAQ
jgi:outer membrane protein TolC